MQVRAAPCGARLEFPQFTSWLLELLATVRFATLRSVVPR